MAENIFERLTKEVVLIDGKHYRLMSDEETVDFIWSSESGEADEAWKCTKCGHKVPEWIKTHCSNCGNPRN